MNSCQIMDSLKEEKRKKGNIGLSTECIMLILVTGLRIQRNTADDPRFPDASK